MRNGPARRNARRRGLESGALLIWRACVHKRRTAIAIAIVAVLFPARWSAAATLALQWDPPATTVPAGYLLWFGTASRSYSNSIDVGSVTMASVDGLSAGTTYYFAVQAYNASGEFGELSDELMATIRPGPPRSLTAVVGDQQSIGLTWRAPSGIVSGYRVEIGTSSGKRNVATIKTGTATTFRIRNLPPGTYYIRVRSVNAGGVSRPSNEVVVMLIARPKAPANLSATVRYRRIVDLTWQAAARASSYRIEVGDAPGARNIRRINTAATKLTISDLPNGVYYIRVRGRNAAGLGPPSNEVRVRIIR
jgi:hypothetical protein